MRIIHIHLWNLVGLNKKAEFALQGSKKLIKKGMAHMGYLRRFSTAYFTALVLLLFSTSAMAEVSFSKTFVPATIGPGSVSTLEFDITNDTPNPVTDMEFSDTLPDGVTIADPASASSNCGAVTLSASAGGSIIDFSGRSLDPGLSCKVKVNVTSSTPGTHTNVSGDLTSSAGKSGTATADLEVKTDRPGFSKSFSPDNVEAGQRSTLTFTIDNTLNVNAVHSASFTDSLPSPMVIASPSNASTTCGAGIITANPGSSSVNFTALVSIEPVLVGATESCTINVDVTAANKGMLDNVSEELLTGYYQNPSVNSGKATATLDVNVGDIHLIKSFTDDPVGPGGTVTLEFSVFNRTRSEAMNGIGFTDDLGAALSGLVATDLPKNDVCGAGSLLKNHETDIGTIQLTGGSLVPDESDSCTFSTTLQVPAGAVPGGYFNETSNITAENQLTGNKASDTLFISDAPVLTKEFLSSPVGGGGIVTMQFSISSQADATDIAFEDNLTEFMGGLLFDNVVSLPADGFCGVDSTIETVPGVLDQLFLKMSGGSLAAGQSCAFDVELMLPDNAEGGVATNTTSEITATIDGATRVGSSASDDLTVVTTPRVFKEFTDDPVEPGATVNLQFTIRYSEEAGLEATGISFTDDLSAMGIAGTVAATGLPQTDVCGAGSEISGTTTLTFSGGALQPGSECIINVAVAVPATAVPGAYTNTTSEVTATVGGVETTGIAADADLLVGGLFLSKSFTNDPVIPGGTVYLEFTLDAALASTNIFFTDSLSGVLSGLLPTGLPTNDICGTGSSLSASGSTLVFTNGSLAADTSCTFGVTLNVPANAVSGSYRNTTSLVQAEIGGDTVLQPAATDRLVVSDVALEFSKSFDQATVAPGGSIDLTFTINNPGDSYDITGITFTDDLGAALSGLEATGLPASDVCGTGSELTGTNMITLTGGNLLAGTQCQFTVTLSVPGDAPYGEVVNNITSPVDGKVGALGVTGDPATDSFGIHAADFTKIFTPDVVYPGDTTMLSFTISNLSSISLGRLGFSDDLDAVLMGLEVSGLPMGDICGTGSLITGTGMLTFTGGSLEPGETCSFDISVLVPGDAAPGSYTNITSSLAALAGGVAASAASAGLVVETPPPLTTFVCHKPGTPAQKTLEIDITSLEGHLGHGDYEGTCEEGPPVLTTTVCHKRYRSAEKTLEISVSALAGHMRHGDYEGTCEEDPRGDGTNEKGYR